MGGSLCRMGSQRSTPGDQGVGTSLDSTTHHSELESIASIQNERECIRHCRTDDTDSDCRSGSRQVLRICHGGGIRRDDGIVGTNSEEPLFARAGFKFIVFQLEQGERGTPHIQGYLEYSGKRRRRTVVSHLGGRAFVDIARGSRNDNVAYCTKQDGRIDGPFCAGDSFKSWNEYDPSTGDVRDRSGRGNWQLYCQRSKLSQARSHRTL